MKTYLKMCLKAIFKMPMNWEAFRQHLSDNRPFPDITNYYVNSFNSTHYIAAMTSTGHTMCIYLFDGEIKDSIHPYLCILLNYVLFE